MSTDTESVNSLMDVVADMKDRLWDLEQAGPRAPVQRLAPETRADQPWSPCTREEASFYANLTDFY